MAFDPPRAAAEPAVGVVVVNYNGADLVLHALASLRGQTHLPRRVVVIDNGSSDGSPAEIAARYPEVELVELGTNAGFAAANNVGIAMLDDCELIALLNPDAVADASWLESLVAAAHKNPEVASFASVIERADEPGVLDSAGDVYHVYGTAWPGRQGTPVAASLTPREVFGASGAAAFYRREWLLRVGSFDARFFCYFEDVDLNLRLQVAGGRCLYVPEARVRHVGGASSGGLSEFTIYHSQRNVVWTYVKSTPRHIFWRYLPLHVVLNALSIATYAVRGHGRTVLRAKRDAVLGLPAMIRARRSIGRSDDFDRAAFERITIKGARALLPGRRA